MALYKGSKPVSGLPKIDITLSDTSANPIQNKTVTKALDDKADTDMVNSLESNVFGSDKYSDTNSYTKGGHCIYQDKLYKCLLDCSGVAPTNTTYWEEVSLSSLNSNLNNKTTWKKLSEVTGSTTVDLSSVEYNDVLLRINVVQDIVYSLYLNSLEIKETTNRNYTGYGYSNEKNFAYVNTYSNNTLKLSNAYFASTDYTSTAKMTVYYR